MSSPDSYESSNRAPTKVPEEFLCPLSGKLMRDPVVLETGETYDRPFIQKWFEESHEDGHIKCPKSNTVLRSTVVTPNPDLRKKISKWCGVGLDEDKTIITDVSAHLNDMLEKLSSSSVRERHSAIAELCSIIPQNKTKAMASGAVASILSNINRAGVMVEDPLVELLATLSTDPEWVEEICRVDYKVPCLMGLMSETQTETVQENCIVVLLAVCKADESKRKEIRQDEIVNQTIWLARQRRGKTLLPLWRR